VTYRAAGLYKIEPRGDSPAAVQQRAKLAKEARSMVDQQRVAFDARREEFMDAAQAVAGAELPPP